MKNLTDKEKVLKILQKKHAETVGNNFYVYKNNFKDLTISEHQIVNILFEFQKTDMISIIKSSPQKDLSIPWLVSLMPKGIYYFEEKEKISIAARREWVRTYMPITISIISLIKSFWPELTSLMKSIMQLLK